MEETLYIFLFSVIFNCMLQQIIKHSVNPFFWINLAFYLKKGFFLVFVLFQIAYIVYAESLVA